MVAAITREKGSPLALLAGKKVLITGALGTLGQALVLRFAEEGAEVFAWDRPDAPNPQDTLEKIAPGVTYVGVDLNDLRATEAAATTLAEQVNGFDILVNNAAYVTNKPHEDFSIEHYEDEIRKSDSFFSGISSKKAEPELLEMATALIVKKTARFDAKVFKDHYQSALRDLISRKLHSKGKRVATPEAEPEPSSGRSNVLDLMAVLKKSLEGTKTVRGTAARRTKPKAKLVRKKAS